PVTIYELRLIERTNTSFSLEVACSKGTYIRTLVEDIAAAFGGLAHVAVLRRTALGPFDLEGSVGLDPLREQLAEDATAALARVVQPIDRAIADWPAVTLSQESAFYLRNGQPVRAGTAPSGGWVRLYEADGHFLGAGEVVPDGRVAPRRLFQLPRAGAEN
ncbi:MAG: tRNA pseudouridine(55) synthase TruB, partial [Pseudomonadota bacterium]